MPDQPAYMSREHVEKFAMAGKATFTILSHGHRRTYRINIKRQKDKDEPIWFVSVLRGADNDDDYTWFALLFPPNKLVHPKSSKLDSTSISVRLFKYMWEKWLPGKVDADEIAFYPSGRCGRCGRRLTVPESIVTGLGPECAGK